MALPVDPASIDDRDVFFKVLKDFIGNVIWYGIAALVISFIGRYFWWVGVVLFGIFALVTLVGFLQFIFVGGLSLISVPLSIFHTLKGKRGHMRGEAYLTAGTLIQAVEQIIFAAYIFYLYRVFF